MGKAAKNEFNPTVFLAKVGTGKTISNFRKDQVIFGQGDIADKVFYIQKGKVKIVVTSDQARKRLSELSNPISSSAKVVSTASHCASRRLRRWKNAGSPR